MPGEKVLLISPFGPFTERLDPWISTFTVEGTGTGIRPILDTVISSYPDGLPDLAQDFATHAQLAGATASHHTFGGGNDGNTDA